MKNGFTLTEMIVVIAIISIIMTILVRVMATGFPLSRVTLSQARSAETARLQLKRIAKGMREARYSEAGAYPLVDVDPQKIVFYSDVDSDDTVELVRYELIGTKLERGLIKPAGSPAVYDPDDEVKSVVAGVIQNGGQDIFTYYNGDYPADQTPLTPADLTEVKYIEFHLIIDDDVNNDPAAIDLVSQVQLRNLKTNLAEQVE